MYIFISILKTSINSIIFDSMLYKPMLYHNNLFNYFTFWYRASTPV